MFELFASRLSRCVVALAIFFAAVAALASPASARPHHRHSAERHAYVHHASRYHHYRRHARSSRFERSAAQLQARGFANTQASYDPNASAGAAGTGGGFGGESGLVSEARRYLGGNPTGRASLWCARFMNMVLQHTGHQGTGSDMASSFAHYGTRVSGPQVGAIAVMSRGRRGGHVGIITGVDAQGNPIMISGNNGNRVREAPISRGRIYAYVMPN
ncbi:TIGR02594 family protein [Bradyrhizobium diazoefficiens]|nr:TIGR02594 family protein [Bradyrhizobium diazoefficiens]QQN63836.1 TIGR02594 family protein [Bradyrhizobium diazoefficiens]